MTHLTTSPGERWLLTAALTSFAVCLPAAAQEAARRPHDLGREPLLPRELGLLYGRWLDGARPTPPCCLFRMPSGPLAGPLTAEATEAPLVEQSPPTLPRLDLLGESGIQVSMGEDNPFFDLRWKGDPGGVGYRKLMTQIPFLESNTSGFAFNLQAVAPAGLQADGVAEGPTVFSPSLSWFQDVGGGTEIHGFVSKRVEAGAGWTDGFDDSGIQYGLAVQSPVPLDLTSQRSIHLFLEALGSYRYDPDTTTRPAGYWELVPGVHWRISERWWMSTGVSVPLRPTAFDSGLWQITCSWRF